MVKILSILVLFISLESYSQPVIFINSGSRANYGNHQEVLIDLKGNVRYYVRDLKGTTKDSSTFMISTQQLDSIFKKAEQVGFFNLNNKYESGAADGSGIYISINSSGRKHYVHLVNIDNPAIKELVGFLNTMLTPQRIRIYYGQKN